MRLLITGSRSWKDEDYIRQILSQMKLNPETTTLVSGACSYGVDLICEDFAIEAGWTLERHPADWSLGKQAGFIRNKEMVDLGADICIAFIRDNSKGATMTANLAKKAGIQTYIINHPKV